MLEPSLQYSYSSANRVALIGYTIIPALLIGLIDVREVKRNTVTAALAGRFGLTNRLEVEARIPYVYRSDSTVSREIATGSAADRTFDASGHYIGDVELGMRYQLNDGGVNTPYYIGSLRFKSRTGRDPFEVMTDCAQRCVGNTTGTGLPLRAAHRFRLLFAAGRPDLAVPERPGGVFRQRDLPAQFQAQQCQPHGAQRRAGISRQRRAWRHLRLQLRHGAGL